ncbi:hypothetical protein, partial [Pseudomonas helleri]|uniref:hypothetical protein n=1 Tax=Pseudomonas helleri TaxID=1608996 RepID=UPI001E3E9800
RSISIRNNSLRVCLRLPAYSASAKVICFIEKLGDWCPGILPNQEVFFRISLAPNTQGGALHRLGMSIYANGFSIRRYVCFRGGCWLCRWNNCLKGYGRCHRVRVRT